MTDKQKEAIVVAAGAKQSFFNPRFMATFADEVAKLVIKKMPHLPERKNKKSTQNKKQTQGAYFLDTSAIIDGRIFDIIKLGLLNGTLVIVDGVMLELKHIADSKEPLKKEKGRRGLEKLGSLKKIRTAKLVVLSQDPQVVKKYKEVDEQLINQTKSNKGRLITCDYNLEKKASLYGITAINIHALAQLLKVAAVPGDEVTVQLVHIGKDPTQGVGYLDDGTMIVVEHASDAIGQTIPVTISRVIQTVTGKILFAKKL